MLLQQKFIKKKNSALLVDARPYVKYLQETIPGAVSIPDTNLQKLIGRFPINKEEKIVVFCGGYECEKSHIVADKLISLGYSDVTVFAGGLPEWKKAELETTASTKTKKDEESKDVKKARI